MQVCGTHIYGADSAGRWSHLYVWILNAHLLLVNVYVLSNIPISGYLNSFCVYLAM